MHSSSSQRAAVYVKKPALLVLVLEIVADLFARTQGSQPLTGRNYFGRSRALTGPSMSRQRDLGGRRCAGHAIAVRRRVGGQITRAFFPQMT